jgi:hypothetical protein
VPGVESEDDITEFLAVFEERKGGFGGGSGVALRGCSSINEGAPEAAKGVPVTRGLASAWAATSADARVNMSSKSVAMVNGERGGGGGGGREEERNEGFGLRDGRHGSTCITISRHTVLHRVMGHIYYYIVKGPYTIIRQPHRLSAIGLL